MLANHEIVVIAVYLAGGGTKKVDTEDVAVKANEIAPGRFVWRKFPDQINIETVRKRLWDAKKADKGGYLLGSEREGWVLTESGREFAEKNVGRVADGAGGKRLSLQEQSWVRTERLRLLRTEAYQKYSHGKAEEISLREAESFFRIDDYVAKNTRELKVLRISNAFANDRELGVVTRIVADLVRGRVAR